MRCAFLLTLLFAQETDFDRLVERLGDPDPDLREQAHRELAESVESARPALERGRARSDAEIRVRVSGLLHRHDRDLLEKKLEREQAEARHAIDDRALFTFRRRAWGHAIGTVLETETRPSSLIEYDWNLVAAKSDRDLVIERCRHHSPGLVYVAGPDLPETQLTVKGIRRWYCEIPVAFTPPSEGAMERIGPFMVTVAWPEIHVQADRPVPVAVLRRTLSYWDIRIRIKPERVKDISGHLSEATCGVALLRQNRAWCGCEEKPAEGDPPAPPRSDRISVPVRESAQHYDLDDLESIELTFHKPIEEPFEVISPPLKLIPLDVPTGR